MLNGLRYDYYFKINENNPDYIMNFQEMFQYLFDNPDACAIQEDKPYYFYRVNYDVLQLFDFNKWTGLETYICDKLCSAEIITSTYLVWDNKDRMLEKVWAKDV